MCNYAGTTSPLLVQALVTAAGLNAVALSLPIRLPTPLAILLPRLAISPTKFSDGFVTLSLAAAKLSEIFLTEKSELTFGSELTIVPCTIWLILCIACSCRMPVTVNDCSNRVCSLFLVHSC